MAIGKAISKMARTRAGKSLTKEELQTVVKGKKKNGRKSVWLKDGKSKKAPDIPATAKNSRYTKKVNSRKGRTTTWLKNGKSKRAPDIPATIKNPGYAKRDRGPDQEDRARMAKDMMMGRRAKRGNRTNSSY